MPKMHPYVAGGGLRDLSLLQIEGALGVLLVMGGKSLKGSGRRGVALYGSGGSSTWNQYGFREPSYSQKNPYYTPQHHHAPPPSSFKYGLQPSFNYGSDAPQPQRTLDRRYLKIANKNWSSDEVTAALAHAGL